MKEQHVVAFSRGDLLDSPAGAKSASWVLRLVLGAQGQVGSPLSLGVRTGWLTAPCVFLTRNI